jgi:hypothetical protein
MSAWIKAPLILGTFSGTLPEPPGKSWMQIRAGTFFPRDSATGESRVAVVRRYRTYHHDPDTIALLTFRSATTELLRASRGGAPEHSHADQYTYASDPTHHHLDLRSFGLRSSDERRSGRFKVCETGHTARVRLVGRQRG